MPEPACFGGSEITPRACPIEESQAGLSQRQLRRKKYQRVDGRELQILMPLDRIKQLDAVLKVNACVGKIAEVQRGEAARPTAHQTHEPVPAVCAKLPQFAGELLRAVHFAAHRVVNPLAVQDGQQFLRLIESSAEFARAAVSFADSRGRPALGREERLTKADQQAELLFLARNAIGHVVNETEPFAQQRLRLLHCGSRQRVPAGLQPEFCGSVDQPGLGEVVSQEFGLGLADLGELLFKHLGDPGMQFLTAAA